MKFFADTADVREIALLAETGMLDGITTNPSLIAKSGGDFFAVLEQITELVSGPVSAEVVATDFETMLREAHRLVEIAPNIVVKVPLTVDGLRTCKALSDEGIRVNVTLCFSVAQALLAAKAGAAFISPFVGRLEDLGADGMGLIADIVDMMAAYPQFDTEVLVASVRTVGHIEAAARLGADVATIPAAVFWQLYQHPLTDKGLDAFLKDWATTGFSIL